MGLVQKLDYIVLINDKFIVKYEINLNINLIKLYLKQFIR